MASGKARPSWHWERRDPRVSGASGDLAKLFRNESVKAPGVLADAAPSPLATIVSREVIQNAWDAARDLRAGRSEGEEPPFRLDFLFRTYDGADKRALSESLGLPDLARRARMNDRRALGLGPRDALDELGGEEPLAVLEVREQGASGMYGRFDHPESKLFLALAAVGVTNKAAGSGGSFGYGKAGLIRGSSIHAVYAYTCFEERPDDPRVTRRLLGMAYWGEHRHEGTAFTGFARFGVERDGWQQPLENSAADAFAERLGMQARQPHLDSELGTSLLLVDPTVTPEDLCAAIERNWWPALIDNAFVVTVTDARGTRLVPRPRRNRTLASFVRAYELAVVAQDANVEQEAARNLGVTRATKGRELPVGSIGLVADLDGWSRARPGASEGDEPYSEKSLVALVRSPRMVVEYLEVGSQAPHVRGVFVAHEAIDDLLRQSEPKSHDEWQTEGAEEGIDPQAHKVAASVTAKVRTAVRDFRKRLRPPSPPEDVIVLPTLQGLLRNLQRHGGAGGELQPPTGDGIRTDIQQQLLAGEDPTTVRMRATVTLRRDLTIHPAPVLVAVELQYRFQEDERSGAACKAFVKRPPAFGWDGPAGGRLVGELGDEPARFVLNTASYSSDWTGRLAVEVELVKERAR